jgi:hypothetical protein
VRQRTFNESESVLTAGQSDFPIDTLERLLRDHERRILQMERRPQGNLDPTSVPPMVAVASYGDLEPDSDVIVFSTDDQMVRHQGATHTLAEWQAMNP